MAQPTPSPSIPLLPFAKDEVHFSPKAPITPATPSPRSGMAGTKRKRPASMTPSCPPPEAIIDISSDSDSDREPTPKAIARRQALHDRIERDDDGFLSISSLSDDEDDEPPPQAKPRIQGISANAMDKADTEPTLCKEQQDVVDLILRGRNVFYTGSAGCGKSTILKAVVKKLEGMGKIVNIVAPTGKAALQVNGMSTWSYMGWTPNHLKYDLDSLIKEGFRKHIRKRIRDTDVLIIDEISMVENHYLERMNHCITAVRCWNYYENRMERDPPPFGGLQLIVTGDFCQLPPVKPFQFCYLCGGEMLANDDETEFNCDECHGPFEERDKWAFKSMAWKKANFEHVHLREIHRQKDQAFIQILQKCRLGIPFSRDETKTLIDHPCKVGGAAQLLCMKHEVNKVNRENFNKLKTPTVSYHAIDEFNWNPEHEHLRYHNKRNTDGTLVACKDHRLEPEVILRVGMLVVLQVNLSISAGLCNGSQGIICGFEDYDASVLPRAKRKDDMLPPWQVINGEYATLREMQIAKFRATKWPVVKFQNGKTRTIFANCMVNSYGKEPYSLLHRTQIPLLPGWAISVHMSQGMTLNRVIVNLSRAFAEGQVYVALLDLEDMAYNLSLDPKPWPRRCCWEEDTANLFESLATALRRAQLKKLDELDLSFPLAYDFGCFLEDVDTDAYSTKALFKTLKYLGIHSSRATDDGEGIEFRYLTPNEEFDKYVRQLLHLAPNVHSLALKGSDILVLDESAFPPLRLQSLSLQSLSAASGALASLVRQSPALERVLMTGVYLESGTWKEILVPLAQSQIMFFFIETCGYEMEGVSAHFRPPDFANHPDAAYIETTEAGDLDACEAVFERVRENKKQKYGSDYNEVADIKLKEDQRDLIEFKTRVLYQYFKRQSNVGEAADAEESGESESMTDSESEDSDFV
ncbi:hypothetical protein LRP88_04303 [Fusarium phalaenopsidis]